MISTLDHLIIVVKDLDEAEKDYTKIFGIPPVWRGEHKELGTINSIFNFENTYFEPMAGSGGFFFKYAPKHAYLSDINQNLITTYKTIRNDVDALIIKLKNHKELHVDE